MRVQTKILFVLGLLFLVNVSFAQKKKKKKSKKEKHAITATVSYKEERQAESHFLNGMKYYLLEDYERALVSYKKSYASNPNNAGCNFQIAQILLGSNLPDEALPYCERAVLLNNENIYYYQLLAECYQKLGKLKEAAKTYEALIAKFPREDDHYFDLANIYLQQGDVDKGLKSINLIEKKYGVNEDIIQQKQQIYISLNKFDKAVEEGEKLIEAFPNEPRHKVELAKLYLSNDKVEEAKNILDKLSSENKLDGNGTVLLSDVYWSMGEKEKSYELLIKAFEDPEYSIEQKVNIAIGFINTPNRIPNSDLEKMCKAMLQLHNNEPKAYIAYGDFLIKNNKPKESRKYYLQALQMDNSFYKVWQNVIIIDSDLGENDSIITHTKKALDIFPNQGIFWYYNGSSNLVNSNYKEAVYSLEKSQKLINENNSLSLIIYAQLGDAYNGVERYTESNKAYERVLMYDPNNLHVLNNYSYFLSLRSENLERALEMCERLIVLQPNNSTYLDTYAWVLYQDKNYKKSKDLLEKALQNSDDGTIVEHYGDVLYQLGDIDSAVKQWEISKSTGDYSDLLDKKLQDKKLYE